MVEITTSLRLNDEDQKVLERLKKVTGIVSTTQVIRLSLRMALGANSSGTVMRLTARAEDGEFSFRRRK